ncbi:MAG: MurR/RpiR family transcriptional regulator [Spirochaetales bacterium]|nr:MurR/RpiR family transcriptional regulator [Spirochaetales bacterium]
MSKKESTFFNRLDKVYTSLTPKKKKIADYLKENYKDAVFFSLAEAAKNIEVSDASLIRFAQTLEYEGFSAMQEDLQRYVSASMKTTVERFSDFEKSSSEDDDLEKLLTLNHKILTELRQLVSVDEVTKFAESLSTYKNILIVGWESTGGLAEYLYYYLSRTGLNVDIVNEKRGDLYPVLQHIEEGSLLFLLSVSRYPKRSVEFCLAGLKKGASLAIISDTSDHPLSSKADYQFSLSHHRSTGFNMEIHIPMLTLIQLIIQKHSWSNINKTKTSLNKLEEYNSTFGIFQ